MAERRRWFHGGRPGLRPGKRVLPPAVTGTPTSAEMMTRMGMDPWRLGMEPDRNRPDRVYLTSAEDLALAYAGNWNLLAKVVRMGPQLARLPQWGALYEVLLPVEAEPDPDFEEAFPGLCVQAPYATVFTVVHRRVEMDPGRLRLTMIKYTTWHAGRCPDCGHHSDAPGARCECLGCVCGAYQLDPTAVGRVYPRREATNRRPS